MLHITPSQYAAIYRAFEDETFGGCGDLQADIEIRDAGLDANLVVGAVGYDSKHGNLYAFYRVELLTFINGGEAVANDFDQAYFIELYKQAS